MLQQPTSHPEKIEVGPFEEKSQYSSHDAIGNGGLSKGWVGEAPPTSQLCHESDTWCRKEKLKRMIDKWFETLRMPESSESLKFVVEVRLPWATCTIHMSTAESPDAKEKFASKDDWHVPGDPRFEKHTNPTMTSFMCCMEDKCESPFCGCSRGVSISHATNPFFD